MDVVKLFKQINPCKVIGFSVFYPHHIRYDLELDVHPVEKPVELTRPLQSHLSTCQLNDLHLLTLQTSHHFLVVLRDIIDPNYDIFIEAYRTLHFSQPNFVIIIKSPDLLHHEVSIRKKEDFLLFCVYGKETNVLA